jgi:hypothetical protein
MSVGDHAFTFRFPIPAPAQSGVDGANGLCGECAKLDLERRVARIAGGKVILGFQGVIKSDPVNPHKCDPLNSLTIHLELPALFLHISMYAVRACRVAVVAVSCCSRCLTCSDQVLIGLRC